MPPPTRTPQRIRRAVAVAAVLSVVAITAACGPADDDPAATPPPTTLAPPPEVDIAYGDVAGCDGPDDQCGGSQQLDIYRSDDAGPNPVLVWVHGGAFVGGDKDGSLSQYLQPLIDEGWDIVAVNYRLTTPEGQDPFPTGLRDVAQAVRWVKANAPAQDWDPAGVAAIGHSAGGNLVEMLAVTASDESLQPPTNELPPELRAVDSSVIAAVALAPVSDLATFGKAAFFADAVRWYVDCTRDCTTQLAEGSVQTHVTPDAAPVLAIHGTTDEFAAPSQGELVQQAYEDAGIGNRFELIVVDDGPRRFRGHDLDLERWIEDISRFLDDRRPPPA